jgi:hypothetical protein
MDINSIIELLVVSFLLIFFLFKIKIIKLSIFRLLYGKYSFAYVNYHKKKYMKNPYPPCINDELVNHCFNFVNINKAKKLYNTQTEISFGVYPFYSKFSTVKRNVIPNCYNIYKISNKGRVKIAGFKKEIPGNENKEIYFFLNDSFFMGEYTFSDVSKPSQVKLIMILASKYKIPALPDIESFYIKDKHDSLIYFENNGFSITIQYINLRKRYVNVIWDSFFKSVTQTDTLVTADGNSEIFSVL